MSKSTNKNPTNIIAYFADSEDDGSAVGIPVTSRDFAAHNEYSEGWKGGLGTPGGLWISRPQEPEQKPTLLEKLNPFNKNKNGEQPEDVGEKATSKDNSDSVKVPPNATDDSSLKAKTVMTPIQLSTENHDMVISLMEQEKATKIKIRGEIKKLEEMTVKWSLEKRELRQTARFLGNMIQEKDSYLEDAKKSQTIAEERLSEETRRIQKDKEIIKHLQELIKNKDSMHTRATKVAAEFELETIKLKKILEQAQTLIQKLENDLAQLQDEVRLCNDQAHEKESKIKQFLQNIFEAFPGTGYQPDYSTKGLPAAEQTLITVIQSLKRKCDKLHQKSHLLEQEMKNGQKRIEEEIVCYRKSNK